MTGDRADTGGTARSVLLDASAMTRCRRRVHLDHDPSAVDAERALPDPASEQRRADAEQHRAQVAAVLAGASGAAWHEVGGDGSAAERVTRTGELVAAGAPLIWGALLP
ncbi:MAG: recombinase RecB, partial [Actinomycetota bacterium]|nr:recombinase RecB [Actinomycetota bacterium]